ncbi:MAG: NAD(P)/FAD-dependent oxidoreductase [Hyphomicrobiaceae bacterium]
MTLQSTDVVIAGGGVVGSATAYYLAASQTAAAGRIVVVEKDMSYRNSSTARSAGGLRQQFSTPENIAMSLATLHLVRNLTDVFGPDADVAFREQGYLILASNEGRAILEHNVALQRSMGADIVLYGDEALLERFPWLAGDGLSAGSFGQSGEGWLDPASLMALFRKAAQVSGVRYVQDTVVGIERNGEVRAAMLASGGTLACGAFVNAAGAAAGRVAALAGLALPVEPRKRYVYVVDCREAPETLHAAPLTVDTSGVWFRPEGRFFLTGRSPAEHEEPPADPGLNPGFDDVDHGFFETAVWPLLAARVPAFEALKVVNAWAGFYDFNTLDHNAILGPHPHVRNFYFANGFSGHGVQQAAAAGRAIAELIVHGRFVSLDLTRFGYDRIVRRAPLRELNVI